jgi:hypothetical protein
VSVKSISCPNCGGAVELRGLAHTLTAVCVNCLSIVDTASLRVLQTFNEEARSRPKIPLGTRGKLDGHVWEALGFQVRAIDVEGTRYTWDEYLLFNPYQGFRYLSDYNGHWNFIRAARGLPAVAGASIHPAVNHEKRRFKHFQTARAITLFAMGEFPWKVQVNDWVEVSDYIHPPYLLSSEKIDEEITWSFGVYRTGAEIAQAFGLPPLPAATGVFANQPNPHELSSIWRTCLWLTILLFAVMMLFGLGRRGDRVFANSYKYSGPNADEFVTTPQFDVAGKPSNIDVSLRADLLGDWFYLNVALVNAANGDAFIAGRELEAESGGWVSDSITFPQVPPGRYYLRIEPEMDRNAQQIRYGAVNYSVALDRDVPHYLLFWLAAPLMVLPALWRSFQRGAFETSRWNESDHAAS